MAPLSGAVGVLDQMPSHCLSCGACCAHFRVSFYWGESDAHPGGTVPERLVIPISPHLTAMRGTDVKPVRCVALSGEVGVSVGCTIYAQRSTTCREFTEGTPECNEARAAYGLPALDAEAVET
jgi:Fe-S-cluster containining protein